MPKGKREPEHKEAESALCTLLEDLLRLLRRCRSEGHAVSLVPGRYHSDIEKTLPNVEKTIEDAIRDIETSGLPLTKLYDHGLIGHELTFKLRVFKQADDEFWDRDKAPIPATKKRGWRRWLQKLFGRALKAGDVVLGSLAQVLPVLGGVAEYKEAIEMAVDTSCDDIGEGELPSGLGSL